MIDVSIISKRNLNESAAQSVTRRVNMLNKKLFRDVQLTEAEQSILVWLCTWDEDTINNVVSAFKKAK